MEQTTSMTSGMLPRHREKLDALVKVKDCDIVGKLKQSIINHMYWSAGSTSDINGDMIVARWESVIQHVQNIHSNGGNHPNALFQSCLHDPLEEDDEQDIDWLNPTLLCLFKLSIIF